MPTARLTALAAAAACLVPLAGAQAAQPAPTACDTKRVHTFSTALPKAPASYKAGRGISVPLQVKRGPVEAPEVGVTLILRGKGWFAYGTATTDTAGKGTAVIKVPAAARGAATLTVDAYRLLATIPCFNIEEYDFLEMPWGKAVK